MLNCREFVSFLAEIESKYEEFIYYNNVRWLNRRAVLKRSFNLINEIKFFMTQKYKIFPELNDDIWIDDLAFLVDITVHLNIINKELQGKNKLIHEIYVCINAFKVKLQLWNTQLESKNFIHFPNINL